MEQALVRGFIGAAVVGLIIAAAALYLGYLGLAPLGFLGFVLATILAAIFATTPPLPAGPSAGDPEPD
jgi:uncharacterized membrane protein YbhN (UPF0104 family)